MGTFPDNLKRLVDRFTQQSDQLRSPDYNETLIRVDFINPLMTELGWDLDNRAGYAEQYREVVHEDRVKVAGQTKAPDYSFRIGGVRKFFLEAKKPAVNIKDNWEPAYQLRRYAWSAKLAISLLTDFEEFAVYDARLKPAQMEKASTGRRDFIHYTDYEKRWDFLHGTFSKDAVLKGDFDRYCDSKKGRGAALFDDVFLGEIEDWRKLLASNLARRNESLDEAGINFAVQRIIDRILFLRIAEDRGTENVGQLQALLSGEETYPRLCKLFRDADARYNSGLFHFAKEKDRDESPDTLTPVLDVDDKTLKTIIKALYYPQSPYEFTMVSADILGSVYERFLGKVITLTAGHTAKIEEKPEVRKAGGVYYTPTYIVDYIVKNTIGKLLPESSTGVPPVGHGRDGRATFNPPVLRVLDPACGSGSFLIGAYQFLLDWYLEQYTNADPESRATGKNPVLRPAFVPSATAADCSPSPGTPGEGRGGGPQEGRMSWRLTIAERKRILLDHIHGVDLDSQAVEVTKLNLLLKCLEGETSQTLGFEQKLFRDRALPDLGKNILCGNSLIGTDIMASDAWKAMSDEEKTRVNPFDYERAFPQAFKGKDGGFDAVIGNPPYLRIQGLTSFHEKQIPIIEERYESATRRFDLYIVFIERGFDLLTANGRLGMICPHKFSTSDAGTALRAFLKRNTAIDRFVSFGNCLVFEQATTYTGILCLERSKKTSFEFTQLDPEGREQLPRMLENHSVQVLPFTSIDAEPWTLGRAGTGDLLARLRASRSTLGDCMDEILVGVQAGVDNVHLVKQISAESDGTVQVFSERADMAVRLERELLKPMLRGDDVPRYGVVSPRWYCVYPYSLDGGKTRIIEEDELRKRFPLGYEYLSKYRAELTEIRERQKTNVRYWYSCHRPRDMTVFETDRIVTPEISLGCSMTCAPAGVYTNTQVYNFVPKPALGIPKGAWLAILNSKVLWFFLTNTGTVLRGGYFRFKTNYLAPFPVPFTALENRGKDEARLTSEVASRVDTMLSLHKRLPEEKLPQRREQIEREIAATDRQIDQLVYQLYGLTEDEIRIVEDATA